MQWRYIYIYIYIYRLTDGGEVVRLTRWPPFTPLPRKSPGTHFYYILSRPQGHSAVGRIMSIEKSNDLIGNRTRDLPACSIVPQPTTLPRAPDSNQVSVEHRSDALPQECTCSVQSIAHRLNANVSAILLH
jgi:hypothetical protein